MVPSETRRGAVVAHCICINAMPYPLGLRFTSVTGLDVPNALLIACVHIKRVRKIATYPTKPKYSPGLKRLLTSRRKTTYLGTRSSKCVCERLLQRQNGITNLVFT